MTTVNVGDDILAATLNRLLKPAMCRLTQGSAGTALTDSVNTPISFDTEDYDDFGMHSPSVNPTRITITAAAGDGKYEFKGTLALPSRADYLTIGCAIAKNGVAQAPWERSGPNVTANQRTCATTATLTMVVGDYVELLGLQDNTGNAALTTPFGGAIAPVLECLKVSE